MMIGYWPKGDDIQRIARIDGDEMKIQAAQASCTAEYHLEVPTPYGVFAIGASAFGVTSLYWPGFDDFDIMKVSSTYRLGLACWGEKMAFEAGLELLGYTVGEVEQLTVPVDISYLSTFQQDVLHAVRAIPRGETITVAQLAASCGHPRKFAPVTNVLRHNPVPIFVPCHRVLPTRGGVGDWSGPLGFKQHLLEQEGHVGFPQPVLA